MKIGIVGVGNVGCACAMAATIRGSAREIVLINRTRKRAEAVATDIRYGTPLGAKVDIIDGDYDALEGAGIVLITSGVNEKAGGATDRSDPRGRLKLLEKNAKVYREILPKIVRAEPREVSCVEDFLHDSQPGDFWYSTVRSRLPSLQLVQVRGRHKLYRRVE